MFTRYKMSNCLHLNIWLSVGVKQNSALYKLLFIVQAIYIVPFDQHFGILKAVKICIKHDERMAIYLRGHFHY